VFWGLCGEGFGLLLDFLDFYGEVDFAGTDVALDFCCFGFVGEEIFGVEGSDTGDHFRAIFIDIIDFNDTFDGAEFIEGFRV
jgi:hypothetical protein